MITYIKQLVAISILWMLAGMSFATNPDFGIDSKKSIFDLMNHTEVLEMTFEADFSDLTTNRKTEDYQKGYIHFSDSDKMEQAWEVKVRPRGKYRRRVCEMPPLKIKFKKDQLAKAGLAEFNDLKLVTHCSESKSVSKNWLLKEYLVYKLYNELTDNSFRVQLVRINYVDVPTGKKSKNWGFLIEDKDQVADRLGAEDCDCSGMDFAQLDAEAEKLMTVFQYLIGNEDWDLSMVRNLKMFKKGDQYIPVPYDFDFSGLVNADYAKANANYGLTNVVERAYFGTSQEQEDLTQTLQYLKDKRKDLITIVKNFKEINFEERATIVRYIESFYENPNPLVKAERKYQQGVNLAKKPMAAK